MNTLRALIQLAGRERDELGKALDARDYDTLAATVDRCEPRDAISEFRRLLNAAHSVAALMPSGIGIIRRLDELNAARTRLLCACRDVHPDDKLAGIFEMPAVHDLNAAIVAAQTFESACAGELPAPADAKPVWLATVSALIATLKLKGKQRRVVERLIEGHGEQAIADIASDPEIGWQVPYKNSVDGIEKALKGKFGRNGFLVDQFDKSLRISQMSKRPQKQK